MKLKDHVLREHRNVPMTKNGKRFILRILPKGHPATRVRDTKANYYCDVWNCFKTRDNKWHVSFEEKQYRQEFESFKDILDFFKREGFKLQHPRHLKIRLFWVDKIET